MRRTRETMPSVVLRIDLAQESDVNSKSTALLNSVTRQAPPNVIGRNPVQKLLHPTMNLW